ncbi:RNA-binding cell elongation regulator Jag/EloR [Thermobrachium celere]|uniref:RNA-binding protein KhpB n=1 Tax=Thermobrachium celere DSM 8682 TaxID=941824 RepID=R7RU70_9CLOT|nr:RNA-binding cell elongation regulator Jag/EloR [Thermobrachium celere]GFR35089.1 DNA/RNA-binding protein [Thermobrachium celere]CDF58966.1 RNA-binding protein Jag [Thermobrachium celere DSM 8682]
MKSIEMTGRTVEEAIESALKELGVKRESVNIEVLDRGSKGIFGLIGSRPAKVKVTIKKDYAALAKSFLRDVLDKMGVKCEIHIKDEDDILKINLVGQRLGVLIGHRGETLDALQFLVGLVINKDNQENEHKKVILDAENYRKKREEILIGLAKKLAYKVQKTNRCVKLEPMNPYERRIIHSALQDHPYVTTYSEGEEPFRKVVIDLKK